MPSDKRNLIMAVPTGLISLLLNFSLHLFTTAAAPTLASWFYQSLPLFSFVLHLFLHHHVDDDLQFMCYGFSVSVSAMLAAQLAAQLAGVLLMLFFAWNVTQSVLSKL